jgi:hypothetical protein
MVVLVSSPIALLVALWGMTNQRTLQLMSANLQPMAPQQRSVSLPHNVSSAGLVSVSGERMHAR